MSCCSGFSLVENATPNLFILYDTSCGADPVGLVLDEDAGTYKEADVLEKSLNGTLAGGFPEGTDECSFIEGNWAATYSGRLLRIEYTDSGEGLTTAYEGYRSEDPWAFMAVVVGVVKHPELPSCLCVRASSCFTRANCDAPDVDRNFYGCSGIVPPDIELVEESASGNDILFSGGGSTGLCQRLIPYTGGGFDSHTLTADYDAGDSDPDAAQIVWNLSGANQYGDNAGNAVIMRCGGFTLPFFPFNSPSFFGSSNGEYFQVDNVGSTGDGRSIFRLSFSPTPTFVSPRRFSYPASANVMFSGLSDCNGDPITNFELVQTSAPCNADAGIYEDGPSYRNSSTSPGSGDINTIILEGAPTVSRRRFSATCSSTATQFDTASLTLVSSTGSFHASGARQYTGAFPFSGGYTGNFTVDVSWT